MRLDLLAELVGLGLIGTALIGREAVEDFRSWTARQEILEPVRGRLNRKAKQGTQWQRKLVALFRLGEAERVRRRSR